MEDYGALIFIYYSEEFAVIGKMNAVLARVRMLEIALMRRRALCYGNDCMASFCNTLCRVLNATIFPICHSSVYEQGWKPRTKEGLKAWNISGWKIREIQKHSLFPQRLNVYLA